MSKSNLKGIESALKASGWDCSRHEPSPVIPFEHVLVSLASDRWGREREMMIREEEADLTIPLQGKKQHKENFIQMVCSFPFRVGHASLFEVFRIINFFNRGLATPGLILDEGTGQFFFRHTFATHEGSLKDDCIISRIRMAELWMDSMSQAIEEVANGQSFEEAIKGRLDALERAG